ncbi:MAG: hypothetical protein Q8M15_02925 [Bacteroidota bacterium]|nr:hypothetical protein [Bacteroidota bacterium]
MSDNLIGITCILLGFIILVLVIMYPVPKGSALLPNTKGYFGGICLILIGLAILIKSCNFHMAAEY